MRGGSVTAIRMLHLGDLHLGWMPASLPARLRQAWQEERDRRLRHAVSWVLGPPRQADVVVLAGDLFDSHAPPPALVREVVEALGTLHDAGVLVVTVPGDHDELTYPDSVYRLHAGSWPGVLVDVPEPRRIGVFTVGGEKLHLYGCAFLGGRTPPAPDLPRRYPEAGVHVGVFHGLVAWPGTASAASGTGMATSDRVVTLRARSVAQAGYDYVAMGHLHRHCIVAAGATPVVWPGPPDALDFEEAGSGHYVVAELHPGGEVEVRRIPVPTRPFLTERVTARAGDRFEGTHAIAARVGSARPALRLVVRGTRPAGQSIGEAARDFPGPVRQWFAGCFHVEVVDRRRHDPDELRRLASQPGPEGAVAARAITSAQADDIPDDLVGEALGEIWEVMGPPHPEERQSEVRVLHAHLEGGRAGAAIWDLVACAAGSGKRRVHAPAGTVVLSVGNHVYRFDRTPDGRLATWRRREHALPADLSCPGTAPRPAEHDWQRLPPGAPVVVGALAAWDMAAAATRATTSQLQDDEWLRGLLRALAGPAGRGHLEAARDALADRMRELGGRAGSAGALQRLSSEQAALARRSAVTQLLLDTGLLGLARAPLLTVLYGQLRDALREIQRLEHRLAHLDERAGRILEQPAICAGNAVVGPELTGLEEHMGRLREAAGELLAWWTEREAMEQERRAIEALLAGPYAMFETLEPGVCGRLPQIVEGHAGLVESVREGKAAWDAIRDSLEALRREEGDLEERYRDVREWSERWGVPGPADLAACAGRRLLLLRRRKAASSGLDRVEARRARLQRARRRASLAAGWGLGAVAAAAGWGVAGLAAGFGDLLVWAAASGAAAAGAGAAALVASRRRAALLARWSAASARLRAYVRSLDDVLGAPERSGEEAELRHAIARAEEYEAERRRVDEKREALERQGITDEAAASLARRVEATRAELEALDRHVAPLAEAFGEEGIIEAWTAWGEMHRRLHELGRQMAGLPEPLDAFDVLRGWLSRAAGALGHPILVEDLASPRDLARWMAQQGDALWVRAQETARRYAAAAAALSRLASERSRVGEDLAQARARAQALGRAIAPFTERTPPSVVRAVERAARQVAKEGACNLALAAREMRWLARERSSMERRMHALALAHRWVDEAARAFEDHLARAIEASTQRYMESWRDTPASVGSEADRMAMARRLALLDAAGGGTALPIVLEVPAGAHPPDPDRGGELQPGSTHAALDLIAVACPGRQVFLHPADPGPDGLAAAASAERARPLRA